MKRVLLYGALGGVLITVLQLVEYQYFVRAYPAEVYGGILAVLFTALGLTLGRKLTKTREVRVLVPTEVTVVREVRVPDAGPFTPDTARLQELGITAREHEVLLLIAEGLSNREIGERLFVSENTVKTHSSRLFEKLEVSRRVQAVQRARELRLVP